MCGPRLYPATPGWNVWRGCVFGLGFWLRASSPGWGVGVCMCSCAHSTRTLPLLAGVCGVGLCYLAWVSAAPRHSWLGCWGVCVLLCPLHLYPATPGSGVRCGCVCLGSGFGCVRPLLAGMLGSVCARVRAPLVPRYSSLGCVVWVCVFGLGFPPRPATPGWGVEVCVCAGVRAPPVPRHSWLGCAAWVCVLRLGFRLRPATPGWGVGVCVCWCGRTASTLPLLAGVHAGGVCVWAPVSAAPCHSWLGCWPVCVVVCVLPFYPATPGRGVWCGCVCLGSGFGCAPRHLAWVLGCVCAGVHAPPVPRHSWLGCTLWVCVLGLGFRLRPATPGWALWCVGWLLGTCSCAVVRFALCALSGFVAPGGRRCLAPVCVPWLWPLACLSGVPRGPAWCAAPRPVRSLSLLRSAFPTLWCLSPPQGLVPPDFLGGCAGHVETSREPGSLCLPLAPAKAGVLGSLRVVPVRGPRWGCPWRVPPAPVLGCVRCGGLRVWTRLLTRPVSRTVRRSTGASAGAPGPFHVYADTSSCGSEDATPGCHACVRVLVRPGRVGWDGLPGAFWYASPFHSAALSF